MNDAQARRVVDKLQKAVQIKRRRAIAARPCVGCGEKLLDTDPMSCVRLVNDVDAEPCETCNSVAAENEFEIVTMVRPHGLDDKSV